MPNRIWRATARLALAGMLVASSGVPAVYAEPVGEQVKAGDASFSRDGNVTQITASDGSIIEYTSFDILGGETVEFIQPSEMARVLNRVLDENTTEINGSLLANGRVYIVNPAGIFFGGEAIIDVGALIAAAGSVTDDDFLAGVDQFTSVMGSVENRGAIEAGSVMLLGRTVANHGSILAPSGMIAMVAGETILLSTLDGKLLIVVDGPAADPVEVGVTQAGTVTAEGGEVIFTTGDVYSLALNHTGMTVGGGVRIESGGGLVEIAGTLDVSGIEDVNEGAGGSIEIEVGRNGDVEVTGDLLATSANLEAGAGGTVSIATNDGSIAVAHIDASGANAGAITLVVNGVGDVTLNGSLRAVSETPMDSGAGGGVTVTSAGALAVGDPSGPHIVTTEDVTLDAASIGAAETLVIDGGGAADSRLSITAEGVVDVTVDVKGFDRIELTQRDASGNIDVVQRSGDPMFIDDEVHIVGEAGTSTVARVTGSSRTRFRYELKDAASEIRISIGGIETGGSTEITSGGDIVIGNGPGTAIEMREGAGLILRAGADADGTGTIRVDGAAVIVMSGAEETAGRLELTAGEGVGTAIAPIVTEGIGELAGSTGAGGFHLENKGLDELVIVGGVVPGLLLGGDSTIANEADIVIRGESGTAIRMLEGKNLALRADSDADGSGAIGVDGAALIVMSGAGETAGRLDLTAGEGVGTATAPIRTEGIGELTGSTEAGGFHLENTGFGELVIIAGDDPGLSLRGDSTIANVTDIVIGNGPGTAIEMLDGAGLSLQADADEDGIGTIEVDGAASIVMSTASTLAGRLELTAGAGVGTEAAPIQTEGIGELTGSTEAGGFHLENTSSGELVLRIGAMTVGGPVELSSVGDIFLGNQCDGCTAPIRSDVAVTLRADSDADGAGDLVAAGSQPHIATPGNVTLDAANIGATQSLVIDGGGSADSRLAITVDGAVDVSVDVKGFDRIELTQRDASGDVDLTQDGGDRLSIDGAPGISTVTTADTRANGAVLTYTLDDEDGADLVIASGSMWLGGAGTLVNRTGALIAGGAGPHITTANDLTLDAANIGAAETLVIDGMGLADSRLAITADGVIDVRVDEQGFDRIELTQRDASGAVDLSQAEGADRIRIRGNSGGATSPAVSSIVEAVTRDGISLSYHLEDSSAAAGGDPLDATLAILVGAMTLGDDLELSSTGDIFLGNLCVGPG
ncbi:MAG: filamentous hemagglutinin N-terminal domain-containing protein, partial [Myxococcota bacterium]